jgi:hypothetical protein
MVLGETVHSFWIAVQTQENMVRNDEAARELQEKDGWSVGSQVDWRKNFQSTPTLTKICASDLTSRGRKKTPLHPEGMEMD